jgi:predicted transcriptional regulator
MKTADQISKLLGVDKTTAYGLLKFMAEIGCATTGKLASSRGKPSTTYNFDLASIQELGAFLRTKIAAEKVEE